jgi:hypothetical protein
MPSRHNRTHGKRHPGVAPHEVVREDFEWLTSGTRLRTARAVEEAILMQSIEGHAHEGHAAFRGHPYVNTTMDDIVESLSRDARLITRHRQSLIDEIVAWARRAMAGEAGNLLVSEDGQCLLDIGLFRQVEVDPAQVLRGMYVGGLRDDIEVRRRAEAKYGLDVGGGRSYLVDIRRLRQMDLDARGLAKGAHEDQLDRYREEGLIVGDEGERDRSKRLRYLYIRHRTGTGTSDDAAMLAAGRLFGPSGAVGAFLADAVDTLEKYAAVCADQDDKLARMIGEHWPELGVSEDDLLAVVYLCAMPPDPEGVVPDCSLRHMIEIDRNLDLTALESHLAHLQGRPCPPMKLDSPEVASSRFYAWFEERLRAVER